MIVTSMQLTISSRRDIAVLQKESSALEGEEDVKQFSPGCSRRRERDGPRPTDGPEPGAAGHGGHVDERVDHQRDALRDEDRRQAMAPSQCQGAAQSPYGK